MTTESNVLRSVLLACSRGATRLFRQNTGVAWVGEVIRQWKDADGTYLTLKNPRRFHAGLCRGSSDLIGWRSITITPDMVGQNVAVFVALECKNAKGRATSEQLNFIEYVQKAGGLAAVVRSPDDARAVLDTAPGH